MEYFEQGELIEYAINIEARVDVLETEVAERREELPKATRMKHFPKRKNFKRSKTSNLQKPDLSALGECRHHREPFLTLNNHCETCRASNKYNSWTRARWYTWINNLA